ncbi:MAG: hypothetical protein A2750_02520 [Candidatus Yanofskybacteria bacterium RIFCSPHIGHO2_01_FULL_45_42]|uniref:Acetyl-CoA acetyltransferase n=2 Tax=Candidatus Yanofskyibacteriota TaxID=1752733 RepID=A0A1F8FLC0_9BACT|nr:MAG: hypothetical protein A2750_02520 [Candidatus Yanofskybacteria bacterium RIFCSPHIGHO2_01_FULL_45_42]OGN13338.1 MAG: hypothetical protein A3J47_03725 [Candidatus Yanofskybacteria bacterium RIFCSPHIGHO2_02_FULL_43_22]
MSRTAIVDGFRSPFCKEGTFLKNIPPELLGAMMVSEMLQRMRNWGIDPKKIDLVIGSNVGTPPDAINIARVAAVKGGLPESVPADTVGKNCGSGIAAVHYGNVLIKANDRKIVLVVATESMSRLPIMYAESIRNDLIAFSRAKTKKKQVKIAVSIYPKLLRLQNKKYAPQSGLLLGLTDQLCGLIMGLTAEKLAKDPSLGITRKDQDRFAMWSHQKVLNAQKRGILAEEILPLYVPRKTYSLVDSDNGVQKNLSLETFARTKPFFDRRFGTVTAANSSQITDGAACALLMNSETARDLGLPVLGYVVDYCDVGYDPSRMGLSPVAAIANILHKTGRTMKDMSVIEINEAFAVQTLACLKVLSSNTLMSKFFSAYNLGNAPGEIQEKQLNPNGGAIALGHPVGVSGLRLIITALKELERKGDEQALVSACIGGGQGNAMILERGQK